MTANDAIKQTLASFFLDYQKALIGTNARFTWNNWSRQSGKSTTVSFRRLLRGIARKRNQFFLSAGERQSAELMLKVKQHIEAFKIVASVSIEEQNVYSPFEDAEIKQLSIRLPDELGGIRIVGLPANPDTARGFTGDVFLDEFAMHKHDREIWASMFPSVMRSEGELDIASTPRGKQNMFYSLKGNARYEWSTVTIIDAVNDGLDANIEELKEACGDDDIWRQEFMCEFIDGATAFLPYEDILACMDPKLPNEFDWACLDKLEHPFVNGIDIGRKHDLTVIWPWANVGGIMQSLGRIELRNTPFREQFETISKLVRHPRHSKTCIDSTGLGMQLAEELVADFGEYSVEACMFTPTLKAEAAGAMKVRLQDRKLLCGHNSKVIEDWHSVEKDVTATGVMRLTASRTEGSHADRFWGAALACRAANAMVGPIEGDSFTPVDRPHNENDTEEMIGTGEPEL